jgi:probable HAF family extracellular repeat protein
MSWGSGPGRVSRALPGVVVLAWFGVAWASPPKGTPLLIPLRPEALAGAVGANGFVVAGALYSGGAFHWMPTSGVTEIGGVEGTDVSRDGKTIVGTARDASGFDEAAIWTGQRNWRLLGSVRPDARPCDALLSSADGTSGDGKVVVGLAWDGCSYARAFRWEEATGLVDLGTLGGEGDATRAMSVSADGRVVVGWQEAPDGVRQGAKWVETKEEVIQGPSGPVGEARAANRDGSLVVGMVCDLATNAVRPAGWTWSAGKGVTCLPVDRPSWMARVPYSVLVQGTSDDGRVMGGSLAFGLDAESVVWFDGQPYMLRDYLRDHGVPDAFAGWINTGFVTDVSADGRTLVGYGAGPIGFQGFVVVLPELGAR